jgi:hypothetical protein
MGGVDPLAMFVGTSRGTTIAIVALALVACGGPTGTGGTEAGPGGGDTGVADGATTRDSGSHDAASDADASTHEDTGSGDAGSRDAESLDTGALDSGEVDTGLVDVTYDVPDRGNTAINAPSGLVPGGTVMQSTRYRMIGSTVFTAANGVSASSSSYVLRDGVVGRAASSP